MTLLQVSFSLSVELLKRWKELHQAENYEYVVIGKWPI